MPSARVPAISIVFRQVSLTLAARRCLPFAPQSLSKPAPVGVWEGGQFRLPTGTHISKRLMYGFPGCRAGSPYSVLGTACGPPHKLHFKLVCLGPIGD